MEKEELKKDSSQEETKKKKSKEKISSKKAITKLKEEKKSKDELLENIIVEESSFNKLVIPQTMANAPVLNQVAEIKNQGIILEREIESSPKTTNSKEDDPFKYRVETEEENEAKYILDSGSSRSSERIDIENLGRKRKSFLENQQIGFRPSENVKADNSSSMKTYIPAERVNVENLGRERESTFQEKKLSKRMKYDIK